MRVALVHDYLREFGGAERVLEALHEIYPNAPIYTAYLNSKGLGAHWERMKDWDIRTSYLQNLPLANKFISPSRILAPKIFENFDLSGFDLVISSCNIYFSKAVKVSPSTLHISYIHTPHRYLYGYATSFNYKKRFLTRVLGELANHFLRLTDYQVSQRPNILVANSKNVAARIKKFYRRDSVVIYPSVDTKRFDIPKEKGEYFLAVNRLVRGKGTEVIVEACTKLNLPIKIAGTGPEKDNLKRISGKSVEFLDDVEDQDLPELYSKAIATIVASEEEDFGIVAVESLSSGTPVIAINQGGYLESVNLNVGVFFDGSVNDLVKVLEKFDPSKFKETFLKEHAEKFSKLRFKKEMLELVKKKYGSN